MRFDQKNLNLFPIPYPPIPQLKGGEKMTKAELIEKIAAACETPKTTADKMVECFVETVTKTLKSGGEVTLTGFGTFSAKKRAARMGVNPKKPGEKIQIPAMVVPKFKAGKSLKDALR